MNDISFNLINKNIEINKYLNHIKYVDGSWNNEADDNGIIVSPYFESNFSNIYGALTTYGIFSFTYLKFSTIKNNKIVIKTTFEIDKIDVVPATNCSCNIFHKNMFEIVFTDIGNHTIIFNGKMDCSLVLFVVQYIINEKINNNHTKIFVPGQYDTIDFPSNIKTLYFKKGTYFISHIELIDDASIIFEDGCLINALPPTLKEKPLLEKDWSNKTRWKAFFSANKKRNITIKGNAIIDLSALDFHARLGLCFEDCNKILLKDILFNNAPEWTVEMFCCQELIIDNIKIIGYRQNSDGIAIVDSCNALIKNCFVRSGDDLFEVKSMDANCQIPIENITFENCLGWADKCRGMGIVHETKRNISNVKFINCQICFSPATWMEHLGSLVIIVADNAKIEQVEFSNIQIYNNGFYPINITLLDSSNDGCIDKIYFRNISFANNKNIIVSNQSKKGSIANVFFEKLSCNMQSITMNHLKISGTVNAINLKR